MNNGLSVSFVMPMFNEKDNIGKTIERVKSVAAEIAGDYEIIITDDASTDGSADVVENIARTDKTVKLYRLRENTKFGGAFAECFRRASKDVIVYLDSDMPVAIDDIKKSFPLIKNADVVTGFSKIKKGDTLKRKFMSRVYNLMVRALFGLNVKDINSGYKIVRRELVKDLDFVSRSPFVDVEIFIHAKKKNAKISQYPLIFLKREGGVSHIAKLPVVFATFRDMIKVRLKG